VKKQVTVDSLTHPHYLARLTDWTKWRYTYEGGRNFIDRYLRKFSTREDIQDFADRKVVTYCPAFAKSGVDEVKNSIYQRMVDITRTGGSSSYQKARNGEMNGVDLEGNSMNSFIGQEVLTELLIMSKVGVFVDMPQLPGESMADAQGARPYVYLYHVEDIRNWIIDKKDEKQFQSVLLRDAVYDYDEKTGFPTGTSTRFRHLWREDGKVQVQFYTASGKKEGDQIMLDIPKIPFVVFEISNSLLTDVADYQIALMNLASSDIAFTLKANFPFYTEQYDARMEGSPWIRNDTEEQFDEDGNSTGQGEADTEGASGDKEIKVGQTAGRRYPLGTDRPGFIHPSSEPMTASMEKQEQLKREIRLLLNLGLANIKTVGMQSAESKQEDNRTLEAGLSNIGLTLEKGEREIAQIWSMYEGSDAPTVNYPVNYSLRSEEDRRKEAEELEKRKDAIPSATYQKEIGKQIATVMLGHYISPETKAMIDKEIDSAPNMVADPKIVASDVENGLVSPETASKLRGYPEGEAAKAEEAHTRRLARIAEAQGRENNNNDGGARGVRDLDSDPSKSGPEEKKESRNTDQDDVVRDKTRGKGQ
jgi:hypothetical protein